MSQPTSREEQRDRLLEAALVHVPFDGWSRRSLFAGAADLGLEPGASAPAVPARGRRPAGPRRALGGPADAGAGRPARRRCACASASPGWCARASRSWVPHREAMRRATAARLLPSNALAACASLWRTVDLMWSAAGDDARDASYYSKRSLLAGGLDQHLPVLARGPLGRLRRDLGVPRPPDRQRHADRPAARPRRRLLQGSRPAQPDGATALTCASLPS